jgi:lysophospholipase L1-like esterase
MKRIALFSVWLLFVLLLLQLAGWVYFTVVGAKPIQGYGYPTGLFVPHPELGYGYRPGYSGEFRGAGFRGVAIDINASGYRDEPFTPMESERARVAFLGDSVVFGAGVAAGERFTECLEQGADGWNAPVVLNFGVNSYSLGHYVVQLGHDVPMQAPDAVIVGLTLNDFDPMENSGPYRRLQRQEAGGHTPPWLERIKSRLNATYAGRFIGELKTRIRYALMNADDREAYHTRWMRTVVSAWEAPGVVDSFAADIDRLSERARSAELPLAFVLFPELNDLLDPETFSAPRKTILGLLADRGRPVCDPYDAFRNHPDPTSLFLPHDGVHYNAEGHQLVCEELRRCVTRWASP